MRLTILCAAATIVLAGCGGGSSGTGGTTSSGNSQTVTGIGGTRGEIIGTPRPGSKFSRVQIGMPLRQVTDTIGEPTDTAAHITGKAFIPFYFGGDSALFEAFYKGEGQLSFASDTIGNSAQKLVRIIVDPNEQGYAH